MLFNYQRRIQYRFYAKVTEVLYEVRQNALISSSFDIRHSAFRAPNHLTLLSEGMSFGLLNTPIRSTIKLSAAGRQLTIPLIPSATF
jgi:hypothetical protein